MSPLSRLRPCLPLLLALVQGWGTALPTRAQQTEGTAPGAGGPTPLEQTAGAPAPLPALPPRPESHLLDESGMFPGEASRALSERLISSQTRTGLQLYLCIHTYLWGESADERASRVHSAWLGKEAAGIVVIHDRSTGRLSFAGSDDPRMPDAEGLRALYRLADSASKRLPPEAGSSERLATTMTSLAEGLESWKQSGQLPPAPSTVAPAAAEASAPSQPAPVHTRPPWPQPAGFVVDEAGVFSGESGAAALEQRLESWHRETGLRLYVVTVTFPPPDLALPLADQLASQWLNGGMGGVIVYDRSQPETLSFGGTPHPDLWLSSVQLKQHHEAALSAGRAAGPAPAAWLEGAAAYLTQIYSSDGLPLLREGQRWLPRHKRWILPWVLGGFVLFAALLYLIQRWQERADRKNHTVFLFPEVYVPGRLGAPHGGGVAAETTPETPVHPNVNAPSP